MKTDTRFNLILNSARMTLTVLVPLITLPYLTRVFTPQEIGRFDWVKSIVTILISFASLGVYNYGVREGVKVKEDRKAFSRLVHELSFLNLAMGALCYFVLFLLVSFIDVFSKERLFFSIYSASIFFSVIGVDWVFGAYEDYVYITVRQIVVQAFNVLLILCFVRNENDLLAYLIIQTLVACIPNALSLLYSSKYVVYRYLGHYQLAKHIPVLLVFLFTKIGSDLYYYVDTAMLGMLSLPYEVGVYSVTIRITNILLIFFGAMSPVILPKLMKSMASKQDFCKVLEKTFALRSMLLLPCCMGLFFLSPSIIHVICGSYYDGSSGVLRVLAVVLLLTVVLSSLQNDILIPKEKERFILGLTVSNIIVNVSVNLFLIVRSGAIGAAYGSLVSSVFCLCIGCWFVRKHLEMNVMRLMLRSCWKHLLASVICSMVCLPFSFRVVGLRMLLMLIGAFAVLYAGILWLLKDSFFIECISLVRKWGWRKKKCD